MTLFSLFWRDRDPRWRDVLLVGKRGERTLKCDVATLLATSEVTMESEANTRCRLLFWMPALREVHDNVTPIDLRWMKLPNGLRELREIRDNVIPIDL